MPSEVFAKCVQVGPGLGFIRSGGWGAEISITIAKFEDAEGKIHRKNVSDDQRPEVDRDYRLVVEGINVLSFEQF